MKTCVGGPPESRVGTERGGIQTRGRYMAQGMKITLRRLLY